ncbi:MAG: YkgJ family cysteine cluster protein [Proteobacteria bacterium]|nr:YkgJ family cysteine cluster protein [Pseudomonadota bacterium]
MNEPTSFLADATVQVATLLNEIEEVTTNYAAASGIRCRVGCGQCCLKPGIDAMPLEMLPLAQALIESETSDQWYDAAAADPDGICVFYARDPGDPTLGRCTQYSHRPSLCRMFGFAAVSTRAARPPSLAACHWHKKLQPEVVAAAQVAIDAGGAVPLFSEYSMRLSMIAPTPSLTQRVPINRALIQAIERLSMDHHSVM